MVSLANSHFQYIFLFGVILNSEILLFAKFKFFLIFGENIFRSQL